MALPKDVPLSFDGIYTEMYAYREQLRGRDITLFFCGQHLGRDNSFDRGEVLGQFITYDQLMELHFFYDFKLGYHSLTHTDLTTLSDDEIRQEVKMPFPMDAFAYPYGRFDRRVLKAVEEAGYREAYSVHQGDGSQFQKHRRYLNW